jgi:FixJ family two-component response regulator
MNGVHLPAMSQLPVIYVVDDDEVVRDSLVALLQTQRYEAVGVASSRDFLNLTTPTADACLILDVHMPDMTGLELLELLRSRNDHIPTVIITGKRDAAVVAKAAELKAIAVLDKPIAHPSLFAAIHKALGTAASLR